MARPSLRALGLLAMALSTGQVHAGDGADPGPGAPAATPRTYALLIGCTEYPELENRVDAQTYARKIRLDGCVNDVRLLEKSLKKRLGARPEDVRTLAGWDPARPATQPTRANIVSALEALGARSYAPGDLVVVHYSGHGVQLPDDDGDEQDGLDEAWFVADSDGRPPTGFSNTLRDDDIGGWLRRIRARGARVWCIMDCCHSGTAMRKASDVGEALLRTRQLDPDTLGFEVTPVTRGIEGPPASRGDGVAAAGDADGDSEGIVAFYAAQSHQKVPEIQLPRGGAHRASFGLLTTAVVRGLERSGGNLSYGELYEQVVAAYRDLEQGDVVQPLAEGDLSRALVGGGTVAPFQVRRLEEGLLELSAGLVYGLSEGTELFTYAAGRFPDPAGRLGRVKITVAGPDASEVVVVPRRGAEDAWTQGEPGIWPAEVARHVFGDTALPLAIVDASGRPVPTAGWSPGLVEVLKDDAVRARFPPAGTGSRARWVLEVDARGEPMELRPARAGPGAAAYAVNAASLRNSLVAIHRGGNLSRLAGLAGEMPIPGNLRLVMERSGKGAARVRVTEGAVLPPGTPLRFRLEKDTVPEGSELETLDVYVFWLDPHFGITRIFPVHRHGSPRLTKDMVTDGPRTSIACREGIVTSDESVGFERVLVLAARKRAGKPELNLDFLEQDAPPLAARAAPEPVESLLCDLAYGSMGARGAGIESDAKALGVGSLTWETRWGRILTPASVPGQPDVANPTATPPTPPDAPPDAWAFGPRIRLAQAGDGAGRAWCVLVSSGADQPAQFLVDLDGEVAGGDRSPAGIARLVAERALDAEIAIRREPTRTLVWYDSDDDGAFDLLLEDTNLDERADATWRRSAAGWERSPAFGEPLLSTPRLSAWWTQLREGDAATREAAGKRIRSAMDRLRTLTRP